jgi:excisionase family DNA binding protein
MALSIFSIYTSGMSILSDQTVLPPSGGATGLRELAAALASDAEFSLVDGSGQAFHLTVELRNVVVQAVSALSEGEAVTLEPLPTLLSTQEAANLLGVSRPTLVKLLEAGEIAFTQPGRHRRVQLRHLLDYQRQLRERRRAELAAMTAEAANDDAYRTINGFTETR